jgi:hypothetical protein
MIELRSELGPASAINVCLYFDARPYDFTAGGHANPKAVAAWTWPACTQSTGCARCAAMWKIVTAVAGPQIDNRYDFPDNLHVMLAFRGRRRFAAVSLSYPPLKFPESNGPLVVCRNGGIRFLPNLDHIDLFWQRFHDHAAGRALRRPRLRPCLSPGDRGFRALDKGGDRAVPDVARTLRIAPIPLGRRSRRAAKRINSMQRPWAPEIFVDTNSRSNVYILRGRCESGCWAIPEYAYRRFVSAP